MQPSQQNRQFLGWRNESSTKIWGTPGCDDYKGESMYLYIKGQSCPFPSSIRAASVRVRYIGGVFVSSSVWIRLVYKSGKIPCAGSLPAERACQSEDALETLFRQINWYESVLINLYFVLKKLVFWCLILINKVGPKIRGRHCISKWRGQPNMIYFSCSYWPTHGQTKSWVTQK